MNAPGNAHTQIHTIFTYTRKGRVPTHSTTTLTLNRHGNLVCRVCPRMSRVSHPPRSFPTPCMQYGYTVLHWGARNGAGEPIMRLLLERKADPNAKDMVTRGEGEGVGTRCGAGAWW